MFNLVGQAPETCACKRRRRQAAENDLQAAGAAKACVSYYTAAAVCVHSINNRNHAIIPHDHCSTVYSCILDLITLDRSHTNHLLPFSAERIRDDRRGTSRQNDKAEGVSPKQCVPDLRYFQKSKMKM